jgi:CheY-like chemotaxis protein
VPNVLVVDDSATDRGLAGGLLAKDDDTIVSFASNGREALASVESALPDVIVCDLQMPEMNGLELVEVMRQNYPSVPVILMTARGSEEIASEALRKGAAGYVPKVALGQNLRPAVRRLMADAEADRLHSRLMHSLVQDECIFHLYNDPELFDPLVGHVQQMLRCLPLGDEAERLRVSIALRNALWIAHAHGSLEVPISLEMDDNAFLAAVGERGSADPWQNRRLTVRVSLSRNEFVVDISHEGSGIEISALPANLQEEAVDHAWLGRFVLLSSVMDDVAFEEQGRSLRLLRRAVIDDDDDVELG